MSSPAIFDRLLQSLVAQLPSDQHILITLRFQKQAPILLEKLRALYGHKFAEDAGFIEWMDQLLRVTGRMMARRPADLRKLDQQRSENKEWFSTQHMLGYCAYVDRFAGNLCGVADRIPHLKKLGVTYLHLLPFLKARQGENDGGFAVSDFDAIEPQLGSMADLQELAAQLRSAGISLCADFILNHVADDHPWALAAKSGHPGYRDYFYHYPDRTQPAIFEATLGQVFPQVAPGNFSFIDEMQQWVWTTFYPYQWDLNYTNPAVFADITAALLQLANRGVEVFRLDSTAFLWKREATNCMNQPEAHWILQALRCIVEIAAPGVLLKAEAIVPTAELPAYLGSQQPLVKECHLAYHSSLMAASWVALAEQNTDLIRQVMQATPELPEQASWLTYVRCHDDIGWNVLRPEASSGAQDVQQRLAHVARFFAGEEGSFARGASFQASDPAAVHGTVGMASALAGLSAAKTPLEQEYALRRMSLLYGLSMCFGGMPLIYMGDEFAQMNDDDYRQQAGHEYDSRWLHRPLWNADMAASAHHLNSNAGSMLHSLSHLLQQRRSLPQLAAHQPRRLLAGMPAEILAFIRGGQDDALVYIANFSAQTSALNLSAGLTQAGLQTTRISWCNQLDQTIYSDTLILPPWSQVWLTKVIQSTNQPQHPIPSGVIA
ncbi:DUF3459 domain-containing protein [Undibacterium sp. Jales W-56]|uniref:alpha-amylase family glycosyl hydrolase n=1 Tax=Undibacterium sp. Jales W-56 TaxID=2897325 RepID=UPI0021CE8E56|nr:alpha-amylase family glycosyl hydrolase [Undibacterium sp. Jales W-56]MCU6432861.1 DUF3459 domain-containing protein [Undibacterium sp. Jales W-56]